MKITGTNLKCAHAAFLSLGGAVEHRRRTGEDVYRHPGHKGIIVVNARRKDAPRALTQAVYRIAESAATSP